MDVNEYIAEWVVRERLAEVRAGAARATLMDTLRPPRLPLRIRLGLTLIGLGRWLVGPERTSRRTRLGERSLSGR